MPFRLRKICAFSYCAQQNQNKIIVTFFVGNVAYLNSEENMWEIATMECFWYNALLLYYHAENLWKEMASVF